MDRAIMDTMMKEMMEMTKSGTGMEDGILPKVASA